jgi:hypothetical protein
MIEIDESVGRPKLLAQIFAGDNFSRPLNKVREELKWLFLQSDLAPALAKFSGSQVHFEDAEANEFSCVMSGRNGHAG